MLLKPTFPHLISYRCFQETNPCCLRATGRKCSFPSQTVPPSALWFGTWCAEILVFLVLAFSACSPRLLKVNRALFESSFICFAFLLHQTACKYSMTPVKTPRFDPQISTHALNLYIVFLQHLLSDKSNDPSSVEASVQQLSQMHFTL